jgi:hypothetical protein
MNGNVHKLIFDEECKAAIEDRNKAHQEYLARPTSQNKGYIKKKNSRDRQTMPEEKEGSLKQLPFSNGRRF